jgi:ubiquinone/menaquinone biosynthesis C-methylase UbiE
MLIADINELGRQAWIKNTLANLPSGVRVLDAGAGELKNRKHCAHLNYVSQDFGQYSGGKDEAAYEGLHSEQWDTSRIDLISDITAIPAPDSSFDAVLCSEVLEHVPEPTHALEEFSRLLKPGGVLILTAPFSSNVHMAPYHYCSGFSRYWYEHHLVSRGFEIKELVPNGDWYSLLRQEITRLGGMERQRGNWAWPLAYAYSILGLAYFKIRNKYRADDLACFGWHCVAVKIGRPGVVNE